MSETPEGYGAQSTPDMGESYPPQTGDLLGSYIARLSARVRDLEAALQKQYVSKPAQRLRDLEEWRDSHENWCAHHKADLWKHVETLESKFEYMENTLGDLCAQMNEYDIKLQKLSKRIKAQSKRIQCLEARIERLEAMMSDPEHEPICRDCGQPEHMDGCDVQPEPTAEPVCATCGHGKGYHQHVMSPGTWCDSGTLGKPCHCREFKPVTTEG